jgi:hypothetical protein
MSTSDPWNGQHASRRLFLERTASTICLLCLSRPGTAAVTHGRQKASPSVDQDMLRTIAVEVLSSSKVPPGARIPNGPQNTTGQTLYLPGGTQSYYPAFWVRDAAMMLGGDFISPDEIEGWVRVIAATQPGKAGLRFGKLVVPGYSIPDHITLAGEACWYPGAYTEQGQGAYGFLPPADDAFFFIQMVREHWRLTRRTTLFQSTIKTVWGERRLSEICVKAFDSVLTDPQTGLVVCDASEGRTRVDWGFCDSIRKTGLCLMPSLLRWQAACDLAALFAADHRWDEAKRYRAEAAGIQAAVPKVFYRRLPERHGRRTGLMLSATGLGCKDDVWASAYAVWLGLLPHSLELAVARHLLALYDSGGTLAEGQVRHLPPDGEFGGFWEQSACEPGTYQNGGFWATPTGWLVAALRKVSRSAADQVLADYVLHLHHRSADGAPWEWIQPAKNLRVNPRYAASAGLVFLAISRR